MRRLTRVARSLASPLVAEPRRTSQDTALANAAEANVILRARRRGREGVEYYLHSLHSEDA